MLHHSESKGAGARVEVVQGGRAATSGVGSISTAVGDNPVDKLVAVGPQRSDRLALDGLPNIWAIFLSH
jgi:hypothetical protein